MRLSLGIKRLSWWEGLLWFGCFGYVEMTRFLMIKFFSFAGCVPYYGFPPFMVATQTFEELRPLYGGVYTVGEYGQGVYFPTWVAA
jgi:hypothetical protein